MEDAHSEKARSFSEDEEDASFLQHDLGRERRRKRWPLLSTAILLMLFVSIIMNVLTFISAQKQDLDDVCSVYTSQSGMYPFL